MKRIKAEGILHLYETLISGGIVSKQEMATTLGVSEKTISRYINDLNAYYANTNRNEHVRYSRSKKGYILEAKQPTSLTRKDILAIARVLLESRGFTKTEMQELLQKLTLGCQYEDKAYINRVISNEADHYVEPRHGQPLIDKLWDLSCAVWQQRLLKVKYTRVGKTGDLELKPRERILLPQGILFSEYYFYLLAFIQGKSFEYPAIYRLDRINEYQVLEERFKVEYARRFQEGHYRKLVQFMQSGHKQTIQFRFRGESLEAVLDRIPTAEILERKEGETILQAQTFGRGIKMWLLSQGDAVEVLGPAEFRREMGDVVKRVWVVYE